MAGLGTRSAARIGVAGPAAAGPFDRPGTGRITLGPMELTLVRHARPRQIEDAAGPADPALTEIGHRQARALAGWMAAEPIDALYVSPLTRARQTAEPLERLVGIEAVVVDGVREYDADGSSYVPLEVLRQDKHAWRAYLAQEETADHSSFAAEVGESIEKMVAEHPGRAVTVICHGGVINVWASLVLGTEPRMFFEPHYTSVNRFRAASTGERSIVSLNETGHLRGHPDLRT